MKKSLLALAVLGAFAGAASAQSSVTIYGKIDLGVMKANKAQFDGNDLGSSPLFGAPVSDKVEVGEAARSRLGFRGTEDLGGGLKANFNIEHSFTPDNGLGGATSNGGAASTTFWSQSWLGLAGGFGEVRLGRDYTPIFYIGNAADPFGYDTVAQAGAAHTLGFVGATRNNNQISYKTPSFGGVTAMVAFAPKEAATGENAFGANVTYAAGPLALGFGYQNAGNQTGGTTATALFPAAPATSTVIPAAGATENSVYILTAAYNLGFVRPSVAYTKATADAGTTEVSDVSNILIGATAPLGGGELKAMYTQAKVDTFAGAAEDSTIKKFGVGYHYPLSKRTKVYADLGSAKAEDLARRTAFDIGVQHNF